jgi:hypothetical protein
MTSFLDRLPFDILFYISSSLHLDDVVHLGQTCRQLQVLLNERTLQRCVVEVRTFKLRRSVDLPKQTRRPFHMPRRPSSPVLELLHTNKLFMQFTTEGMHYPRHCRSQLESLAREMPSYIVRV